MPASRVRHIVFTWNSYPDEHEDLLRGIDEISYCVYQEETGESGNKHLQGYIELSKQMSLRKIAGMFPWHIEPRKGTQAQAIAYCTKEDTRTGQTFTWGEPKKQGKRSDIARAYEMVRLGKRERDIAEEVPVVHAKYHRGIERYRSLVDYDQTKEFRVVQVSVFWGAPGTGKTRRAVDESNDEGYFILGKGSGDRVWWDGYQGEKNLIIDDFYGWIKYSDMLNVLDGYQYRAEVKGGFKYAKWTNVYITSNKSPQDWYPNVEDTGALMRRIDDTIHFNAPLM